jgi:hypothetical protein
MRALLGNVRAVLTDSRKATCVLVLPLYRPMKESYLHRLPQLAIWSGNYRFWKFLWGCGCVGHMHGNPQRF